MIEYMKNRLHAKMMHSPATYAEKLASEADPFVTKESSVASASSVEFMFEESVCPDSLDCRSKNFEFFNVLTAGLLPFFDCFNLLALSLRRRMPQLEGVSGMIGCLFFLNTGGEESDIRSIMVSVFVALVFI